MTEYTAGVWSTESYIYGGLILSLCTITCIKAIEFSRICVSASQNLHDRMFHGIVTTRMLFFHSNPSGRIMNRISNDLGSIDDALPRTFLYASRILLNSLGAILITITFSNTKFAIIILVLGLIFVWARKYYLMSSTNIKRLEGASMYTSHLAILTLCSHF